MFVNVNMGRLGAGFEGFAPRENVHFKRPGGTNNYVHGGMSLQELCVPVIGFWRARSGSKDFVDTRGQDRLARDVHHRCFVCPCC